MARLTIFVVCSALYLVLNPVDCNVWGDIAEKFETNDVDVKLTNTNTKVKQEIPAIYSVTLQNKNATNTTSSAPDQRFVTITVKNATQTKQEIPKVVQYQARIVATTPNTLAKTITYKLGKRVAGK